VIARHAGIEGPLYRDRVVLELGPGNALGVPLVARLRGARACEAYDAFDIVSRDRAYLDAIYQPIARSEGGSSALVDSCIMHTSHASLVRGGRRFDRVVSRAVLEHVKDLERLFDALGHVVTRDVVAVHEVDLRSHGIEHDHPLDFLTVSGPLWRAMTSHTDAPNRVRAPAYLTLGERAGLTLVWAASRIASPRTSWRRSSRASRARSARCRHPRLPSSASGSSTSDPTTRSQIAG
jgi:Methyltransferase domain